jgi:hypothetical protein
MFDRRRLSLFAVLGCALVLISSFLTFAADSSARKELEALYAKHDQAMQNKDWDYIKSLETEDYTEKSKEGTVQNKEQADHQADAMLPMLTAITSYSTIIDTISQGKDEDEVICDISDRGVFIVKGNDSKDHTMEITSKGRDTWIHTEPGWRIKYHHGLESTTKMDGQLLN